jgi:3-hydroxyacyl-CoA dehydrogenase/3-hydroxy-2-methylbutyryl-CoA dehydrogenase
MSARGRSTMQVEGSVALVTGGVSGLGLGAARRLVSRGASVVMFDIDEEKGKQAAAELGDKSRFIICDVSNPDDVSAGVSGARDTFGSIDILVNAAGVASAQRVVSRDGTLFDLDRFKFTIGVNLIGMFDVIRNTAAVMSANEPKETGERGVIVNVASIAAYEGQVGQAAYSASKGGIVGMTLPLARDLGGAGIRVVTVAPGIMDTPLLADAPQELKDSLAALAVFPRRLGTPDDFAHLVQAIVENPMINGEVIRLDAGARMPAK